MATLGPPLVRTRSANERRGLTVVYLSLLLVSLIGFMAFSVDVGYMLVARTRLQIAADSAALAGISELSEGASQVQSVGQNYAMLNQSVGSGLQTGDITVQVGDWDKNTSSFVVDNTTPTSVRVLVEQTGEALMFGKVLGVGSFDASAEAITTFTPRDIMLVIDCSGSMNNDSEFKSFNDLGQVNVENNIFEIYTDLGSPSFGNMQWAPVTLSGSTSTIKTALGLDSVTYPYPSGSWDDFINYVQNDSEVNDAGYDDMYGYLTLVQYWIADQAQFDETPDLWMTRHQPLQSVKSGITLLTNHLLATSPMDQLGLVIYSHPSGNGAILEAGLTSNYAAIDSIANARQAKHYTSMTNIGAGIRLARIELEDNARATAKRVMVLMTDGQANEPGDEEDAEEYVEDQADNAAAASIVIYTISVGSDADTALMQDVADRTGGVHFNIPGGQSVAAYSAQLLDVFRRVAAARIPHLVQ